ncbi:hypothetical protein [Flavobacterium sp. GT3P67]|uniref:hypothetical protein n=1 Tax=Flavobacterium sp. GT3P67 TaxID=2541722 RepID=UPI001043C15F|nr:hypothetical protein [Flavobacterium sp. GT3P67]TDE55380.1 hypothetical protein E0H99_03450 [Flavobacterium sp. GT3P67]
MAKTQPTLEDLVEIFIQSTVALETTIKKNIQEQTKIEKNLSNINIKPDLMDVKINQQEYYEKINLQSQNHIQQINESSNHFEKVLQKFNTKNFNYLLILNLFFFLTSGISIYVAIKKSINKHEFLELQKENDELESKILNITSYFKQNPKSLSRYKKWYQQNKENH